VGDREAVDPVVEGASGGGGTQPQDGPVETLFAAIVYALVEVMTQIRGPREIRGL
jgi:hypothetical protein